AGRAVHGPRGATKAVIDAGGVDGTMPGLGSADPALFSGRGDDRKIVPGHFQRVDQFVQKHGLNAVVVRQEEPHEQMAAKSGVRSKSKMRGRGERGSAKGPQATRAWMI